MLGSRLERDGLVLGMRMPELLSEVRPGEYAWCSTGLVGEELRVERRGWVTCQVMSFLAAVCRR